MDEKAVFAEAAAECLKRCFAVLQVELAAEPDGESDPEARFRHCCALCRRARAVADAAAAPA